MRKEIEALKLQRTQTQKEIARQKESNRHVAKSIDVAEKRMESHIKSQQIRLTLLDQKESLLLDQLERLRKERHELRQEQIPLDE